MEPKHAKLDEIGCKISNVKLGDKEARLKGGEVKPLKDDDVRVAEAKLDLEVEREWKQLQNDSATGKIEVSTNPRARKICKGLSMYAPYGFHGSGRGVVLTLRVDEFVDSGQQPHEHALRRHREALVAIGRVVR